MISKRLRNRFREYLVGNSVLREIETYFDNYDIAYGELTGGKEYTSERRTMIECYYSTINWQDSKDNLKVLKVFKDIMIDISSNTDTWNKEQLQETKNELCEFLKRDGFKFDGNLITKIGQVDFEQIEYATSLLDRNYFQEYIERIKNSIESDPKLSIGSSKELIESTLKTILTESKIEYNKNDDIPKLLKAVQKELELVPNEVDQAKKGSETIKILLSNLGQVVIKTAELRNLYGTGHGYEKKKGLNSRHARLVVNSAIALCTFLLETFEFHRKWYCL